MMQEYKNKFPLFLLFLSLFIFAYGVLELYTKARVDDILDEQEKYLELSYNQGIDRFEDIAKSIYISMQNDQKLLNLIANVNNSNIDAKHKQIYEYLKADYEKQKLSGVLGIQITTPQNISIVRMHEKSKYGDSLADVRPMMRSVNKHRIYLHGFEEGKTSHAFREIFPLYNNGVNIGAMEVLFSSTKIQDYTKRASFIYTHFIVDKNVFKTNEWKSNSQDPYMQSIEHKEYLFSMNKHMHKETLQSSKDEVIKPLQEEINEGFKTAKSFKLYKTIGERTEVVVFLAVQRFVDKKTVAYLVSYTDVKKLHSFLQNMNLIKVALLILTLAAYIIITRLLLEKQSVLHELKHDGLTKLYTRKYFMDFAHKEMLRMNLEEESFCIVMADIDFFKKVNDTYGHLVGDEVIKEFALILKESTRSIDVVARYGGEEFIIFLYTDMNNAYKVVEQIRTKVQAHSFSEKEIELTASFGLVESKVGAKLHELISQADQALYRAKESGRNQTQMI